MQNQSKMNFCTFDFTFLHFAEKYLLFLYKRTQQYTGYIFLSPELTKKRQTFS